ncbi:MAG TPA: N-acetylmuramoyl-L-alanine amidase, partial [Terriglobales bacterium]|nr:N-acetylmuramoyl-L-alanine amidase [Terriglobales bacterium]
MSATPNNAGAAWSKPLPETAISVSGASSNGAQNALQALLAFACIHEQATRRRRVEAGKSPSTHALDSKEEQFALDEVLQLVSARAVAITGADGVAIALAQDDAIVCRASFGRISPDPGIKLDAEAGFSGACLRSGQTVRCDDTETDSRVNAQVCRILGTRSMIAVPLTAKGRVVGLVEAFSTEPHGFNDSDVRSLNLLGELILAAIRPEEEDRLAEVAGRLIIPQLAPAAHVQVPPPVVPPIQRARARIIVDEKFVPPPGHKDSTKPEAPVIGTRIPIPEIAPAQEPIEKQESKQKIEEAPVEAAEPVAAAAKPAVPVHVRVLQRLHSLTGMGLAAALVVVALGLAWAISAKIRHGAQAISADTQQSVEVRTAEGESREIILPAPAEVKAGPAPQVTGLRHWASGDTSTVVVDLQDQVQYEAHSLDNPSRIYFDLHDTKIGPGLSNNENIEVNDALLKRLRMAQPVEGVTRVVLETSAHAEFSVSLDPNPYRLTIEVRKPTAANAVVASATPLPKPSPSFSVSPKAKGRGFATSTEFQVVLDAGHGGWDLGTVGKKGLLEKDVVLDIVQRVGKLLESKLGAQVIYTRQDDSYLPLEKRAEIANLAKADLFLS